MHSAHAEIAAFVAAYAPSAGGDSRAATDDTNTMRPPRSMMPGSSANVRRTGDK